MTDVLRVGTDTSGRPILMTPLMRDWWDGYCERLGFTPTITQGAWMTQAGGGAGASKGYHDGGGCLDLRVWDRTGSQVRAMVATARAGGAAAWLRDKLHGGFNDPHIHLVLGDDDGLATGAAWQWGRYLAGRDGLATDTPDYHPRPSPLVTAIPEDWTMPTLAEIDDLIAKRVAALPAAVWAQTLTVEDDRTITALRALKDARASARRTKEQTAGLVARISAEIAVNLAGADIAPEALTAAVEAGVRRVLGSLDDEADQ